MAKSLILLLICALITQSIALGAEPATTADTKVPPCRELLLPNGLKVLLLEDHSYPVVSCLSWYRVGSRNERPGATGITHLVEHMLFGKVGSFRRGEIGSAIARVGGQFNGYTSDDFTTFFETLPPQRLELALRIEAERMRGAQFSEADVQEEIENIQREFENQSRDPSALLSQEVRSMLYVQHPYHNPTIGWRSDVEELNAAAVKAHYDKYFGPNNCTLVIAGDFQSKATTDIVQKYFGGIPQAPNTVSAAKLGQEAPRGERRSTIKYPGKQEILEMAFHGPALDDPDAPATVVLEKLLNTPLAGRFKTRMIEPKICATANAAFEPKKDPGFIELSCTAIPGTPGAQQKIVEGLDAMLGQLRSQPVSDAELRRARNQAEFAFYSERESPYRAGFHLGYFESLSSWKTADTWPQLIRAVTAADVQRVAKKYLSGDNRVIAWLAGAGAPKPVVPKSEPSTTPSKPGKAEHVHLTGYKDDDNKPAPNPSAAAVQKMPTAIPTGVKKLPAAIGNAPASLKEIPAAVEAVPAVIKNLPSAVGSIPSAIKQIPSTLGSVPSAIRELPAAVGGLPGAAVNAVKELPGAIGGLPGAAVGAVRELPGAIGGLPGATAGALKSVPAAIGTFATELGGIPSAIGKQLWGPQEQRVANGTVRRVLKNGINLIVHESHISPVVQIAGASKAGTAYEPAGKRGISTVTAAALNLGSARRGRTQLLTVQEDLGIQPPHMVSFDNDAEKFTFTTRCLSRDVANQLDIIAESLTLPTLNEADFDKAKQDAVAEVQRSEDTNTRKAGRAMFRSLLASGSPFVPEPPSEVTKSINNLGAADVRKFLNTSITPNDTTIVVVGDINPDAAAQLIEKSFASWTAKGAHQKLAAHPNPRQVMRAAVPTKDKTKTTIAFGKLMPGVNSPAEYAPILIADAAFSKHPLASRLGLKLAADESLAKAIGEDSIDTNLIRLGDGAAWSFDVDVEPNTVPLTVSALQSELQRFGKQGISQDEFIEARRFLLGTIPVRSMGTLGSISHTLLEGALRNESEDPEATLLAHVRTASLDSVNRVITHHLKPEIATMVVVGTSQSLRATRNHVAVGQNRDRENGGAGGDGEGTAQNAETQPGPEKQSETPAAPTGSIH